MNTERKLLAQRYLVSVHCNVTRCCCLPVCLPASLVGDPIVVCSQQAHIIRDLLHILNTTRVLPFLQTIDSWCTIVIVIQARWCKTCGLDPSINHFIFYINHDRFVTWLTRNRKLTRLGSILLLLRDWDAKIKWFLIENNVRLAFHLTKYHFTFNLVLLLLFFN